jgi:N-acetylglucosamine kinase-like BadF-type ATPase
MPEYVIGVDGGNSKTDVVVATTTGRLLARLRGPGVNSPLADADAWRKGLIDLVSQARDVAGVPARSRASAAVYFLANVDLPAERRVARRELVRADQAELTVVQNDTVAVLRAGATRPWGIAVTAGAGINAVGVHPSARVARFLALGDYTGDLGGGQSIGMMGLAAAIRDRDARGPATALSASIPAHYGMRRPEDVAIAVHAGRIRYGELYVLAPLVFAAARAGDEVAARIVAGFADEVVIMVGALVRRLHLSRSDVEVVLGGGTLQNGNGMVLDRVTRGIVAHTPGARVSVLRVAPVFGAVVEAFERAGSDVARLASLREVLVPAPAD